MKMKKTIYVLLMMFLLLSDPVHSLRTRLKHKAKMRLERKADAFFLVVGIAFFISYLISSGLKLYSAYIIHKINLRREAFISEVQEFNYIVKDMKLLNCVRKMNTDLVNSQLIATALSNHKINESDIAEEEKKCMCSQFANQIESSGLEVGLFDGLDPMDPKIRDFLDSYSLKDLQEKENADFMKEQKIEQEAECLEKFNKLGVIDPNDKKCLKFKHLLYKTTLKKYKLLNLLNPDVIFGAAHQRIRNTRALFVNAEAKGDEILSFVKETDFMGFPIDSKKKEKVLEFLEDAINVMKKVTGTGIKAADSVDELITKIEKFVQAQITDRVDKITEFANKQIESKNSIGLNSLNDMLKLKAAELIMFAKEKAEAVEIEVDFRLPTMKNLPGIFTVKNVKEKFANLKAAAKAKVRQVKQYFTSGKFKKKAKLMLARELIDFRTFAIEKATKWVKERKIFGKKIGDLTKNEIVINIYQIIRKSILGLDLLKIVEKIQKRKTLHKEIPNESGRINKIHSPRFKPAMPLGMAPNEPSVNYDPNDHNSTSMNRLQGNNPLVTHKRPSEKQNHKVTSFGLDESFHTPSMSKYKTIKMHKPSSIDQDNSIDKFEEGNIRKNPNSRNIGNPGLMMKNLHNPNNLNSSNTDSKKPSMRFTERKGLDELLEPTNIPKLKEQIVNLISEEANELKRKFNLNMLEFDAVSMVEEIQDLEIENTFEANKINLENYINAVQMEVLSNFREILTENTTILFNKFTEHLQNEIAEQFTMDTGRFDSNVFGIIDQIWEKGQSEDDLLEKLSNAAINYTKDEFEDIKNNATINPYLILRHSEEIKSIKQNLINKQYSNDMIQLHNIVQKAMIFKHAMGIKDITSISRENQEKRKSIEDFFKNVLETVTDKIRQAASKVKQEITVKNAIKYGKKALRSVVAIVKESAKETISESVIGILNNNINGLELKSFDSDSIKTSVKGLVIKALNKEKNKYINELKSTAFEMMLDDDFEEMDLNKLGLKFLDFNKNYAKTISEKFKSGLKKSAEGIFNDIKKELSPGVLSKKIGANILKKVKGKVNKFIEKPTSFARALNLRKMLAHQVGFRFKQQSECFETCLISSQISKLKENIHVISEGLMTVSRKITKRACTSYDYLQKEYSDEIIDQVKQKITETDQKVFEEMFKVLFMAMKIMNQKFLTNLYKATNLTKTEKTENEREKLKHKQGRSLVETFRYMYLEMEEMEEMEKNDTILKKINEFRSVAKTFIDIADDFFADDMGYIGVILSMSTVIFSALEVGGQFIFFLKQKAKDNNELKTEFAWEMFIIKAKKFVKEVKQSIIKKIFAPIVVIMEIGGAINKVRKALILSKNEDRQLKSAQMMLHQRAIYLVKNNEFESCKSNLATLSFVNDVYEPVRILREKIEKIKEAKTSIPEAEEHPQKNPTVHTKYRLDLDKSRLLEGCYYNLPSCILNKEDSNKVFSYHELNFFKKFFNFGFYSNVMIALNFEQYQLYKSQGFEVIKVVPRQGTDLNFKKAIEYNKDYNLFNTDEIGDIQDIDDYFIIMACKCSLKIYIEKLEVYSTSSSEKAFTRFNIERRNSKLDCVKVLDEKLPPECDDLLIYTINVGYETLVYSTRSVYYNHKIDYAFHRYFNGKSIHAQIYIPSVIWKSLKGTQHSTSELSRTGVFSTEALNLDTERESLLINDYSRKKMYFKIFDSYCIHKFNQENKHIIEILEEETAQLSYLSPKHKGAVSFNWVISEEKLSCKSDLDSNSFIGVSFDQNLINMKLNGISVPDNQEQTITFEEGDILDFDFFSIYGYKLSQRDLTKKIEAFEKKVYTKIEKKTVELDFYRNYIIENKSHANPQTNYDLYSTKIIFFKKHSLNRESQLRMSPRVHEDLKRKVCDSRLNPCNYRDKMQAFERYHGIQQKATELNKKPKYSLIEFKDKSKIEVFRRTNPILNKTVISEDMEELKKHDERVESEKNNVLNNTDLFAVEAVEEEYLKVFSTKYNFALLPNKIDKKYILQEMAYIYGFAGISDNFSSPKCKNAVKDLFKGKEYSLERENVDFKKTTTGYHNMTNKLVTENLEKVDIKEILHGMFNMTQLEEYNKDKKYKEIGKNCSYFNFTLAFNPQEPSKQFNAKVEKVKFVPGEEKPVLITEKEKKTKKNMEIEYAEKEYFDIHFEEAGPEISLYPTMWVDIGVYNNSGKQQGSKNMFDNVNMAHLNGYDLINNPIDNELKGSQYAFGKDLVVRMNFYSKTRRVLDIDYQSICPKGN